MVTAWTRLKRGDDWGTPYWAVELTRPGVHGHDSRYGIKLTEGEPVAVRLADGTISAGRVIFRSEKDSYGDHGVVYNFTSRIALVELSFHETPLTVPLENIDVPADWVKAREPA